MSSYEEIDMECPQCGSMTKITLWSSLNVDVDPWAKEELLQGNLNLFRCPSCKAEGFLPVPFLYNDMNSQVCIQYVPFELLVEGNLLEMFNRKGQFKIADSMTIGPPGDELFNMDYMLNPHVVFDINELIRYVLFRDRLNENARE